MLKELYIHNYRNFINCSIPINKDFTLICGKNGTGKTTVIEIFHKLSSFITSSSCSVADVACEDEYPRWERKDHGKLSTILGFNLDINNTTFKYSLEIEHNLKKNECRVKEETLYVGGSELYKLSINSENESQVKIISDDRKDFSYPADWNYSGISLASRLNSNIRKFIDFCGKIIAISFDYDKTYPITTKEKLEFKGDNFREWYFLESLNNLNIISNIINTYKEFIPNLVNVSSKNDDLIFTFNKGSEYSLTFGELSTGQKRLCMYYFLLYTAKDGAIILIDELENHLSPGELNPLYNVMLNLAESKKIQFIFVSHNHRLVNWYQNNALILKTEGNPAIIKVEPFNPNESSSLAYHLEY